MIGICNNPYNFFHTQLPMQMFKILLAHEVTLYEWAGHIPVANIAYCSNFQVY